MAGYLHRQHQLKYNQHGYQNLKKEAKLLFTSVANTVNILG
jgi:hypothetical protein